MPFVRSPSAWCPSQAAWRQRSRVRILHTRECRRCQDDASRGRCKTTQEPSSILDQQRTVTHSQVVGPTDSFEKFRRPESNKIGPPLQLSTPPTRKCLRDPLDGGNSPKHNIPWDLWYLLQKATPPLQLFYPPYKKVFEESPRPES